jgi:hypothetical protein
LFVGAATVRERSPHPGAMPRARACRPFGAQGSARLAPKGRDGVDRGNAPGRLVAVGTAWLAFVVHNDWSVPPVIAGLITVCLGQGALVTLLFNVLVTASPKELAGDVGSLRGVTQNLAAAVGTAVVGALLVGLLSTMIIGQLNQNPVITAELKDEVNLTNLNFMRDAQIKERLGNTSATPEQLTEALRINAEARIRALKIGFLCLSGLALLALLPCRWLPNYRPDELPAR